MQEEGLLARGDLGVDGGLADSAFLFIGWVCLGWLWWGGKTGFVAWLLGER